MRYIKLIKVLSLLSAFVLLASCGGGTGGGAGTSTVTIAIGGTGELAVIEQQEETLFAKLFDFITPNDATAGISPPPVPSCFIPPDVHRVVFNISGLGMAPISREVIVGTQCPILEEFEVPNGSQRIFSADEYSVSGAHLYTGATAQDIFGADHVQIIMRNAGTCSRNFNFGINPGTYALYAFSATSLTESIDVHLTSDQESQLSLIDINSSSIVCDPVCGSTDFGTNLNITHVFTAPDFYGIKVGNFGNAFANYLLDVTMAGDETVCDSIVSIAACFTDTDCPPDRMCVEGFCEPRVEPVCGDGNLDPGEECDDGNTFVGDGCSAICTIECILGETNCGGICVDTQTDLFNCGGCAIECGLGEECLGGICYSGPA
jgi:cysteine-rich repeat protein